VLPAFGGECLRLSEIHSARKALAMADEAIRLTVELTFLCEFANPNAVFEWVPALFGNPADSAEGAGSRHSLTLRKSAIEIAHSHALTH
jgi:hypothetical protein